MTLFERQIMTARAYRLGRKYCWNLAFAKKGIEEMLKLCPRSYVSLSFGKQSLCLAHLVFQTRPMIPMFFLASSESWYLHDYIEVIDDLMRKIPIDLTIVQTNHANIDLDDVIEEMSQRQPRIKWIRRPPGDRDWSWKQCRDRGDNDLAEMCIREQWDGWFWGLAKEENKQRAITLSQKWEGQSHPSIFRYSDGKYRCCPLMFWHWEDIAAYVLENDLKLLNQYEKMGLQTRTTARITKKMVGARGMEEIKFHNKKGYWKLIERFPEIRA